MTIKSYRTQRPHARCLDHLMQHKCPLCRERFSPRDIRKLHVDRDLATRTSARAPQIDNESQRLLHDIVRVFEGGKVSEIQRVIDECKSYYKSQPGNQVPFLSPFLIPERTISTCSFSSTPPSRSVASCYITCWRPAESWEHKRNSYVKQPPHAIA